MRAWLQLVLLSAGTQLAIPAWAEAPMGPGADGVAPTRSKTSKRRRSSKSLEAEVAPATLATAEQPPEPELPPPAAATAPVAPPLAEAARSLPVRAPRPTSAPAAAAPSGLRLGAGLTVGLAALGLLLAWVLKRGKEQEREEDIEILSRRALGTKSQIVLVRARDREFLLTTGDHGTTLIGDWGSEPENAAEVPEGYCPNPRPASTPRAKLSFEGIARGVVSEPRPEPSVPTRHLSPAVQGLVALRRSKANPEERWFSDGPEIEA